MKHYSSQKRKCNYTQLHEWVPLIWCRMKDVCLEEHTIGLHSHQTQQAWLAILFRDIEGGKVTIEAKEVITMEINMWHLVRKRRRCLGGGHNAIWGSGSRTGPKWWLHRSSVCAYGAVLLDILFCVCSMSEKISCPFLRAIFQCFWPKSVRVTHLCPPDVWWLPPPQHSSSAVGFTHVSEGRRTITLNALPTIHRACSFSRASPCQLYLTVYIFLGLSVSKECKPWHARTADKDHADMRWKWWQHSHETLSPISK